MSTFNIGLFECDFYSMLFKHYPADTQDLDRKLFWRGMTLHVIMEKGTIQTIEDIRNVNLITVYEKKAVAV